LDVEIIVIQKFKAAKVMYFLAKKHLKGKRIDDYKN